MAGHTFCCRQQARTQITCCKPIMLLLLLNGSGMPERPVREAIRLLGLHVPNFIQTDFKTSGGVVCCAIFALWFTKHAARTWKLWPGCIIVGILAKRIILQLLVQVSHILPWPLRAEVRGCQQCSLSCVTGPFLCSSYPCHCFSKSGSGPQSYDNYDKYAQNGQQDPPYGAQHPSYNDNHKYQHHQEESNYKTGAPPGDYNYQRQHK